MEHHINLTGYIEGDLTESETKTITEHLKTCHGCRKMLEDLKKELGLFSMILEKQPDFFKNLSRNEYDDIKVTCDYPLPDSIKILLNKKKTALRERLSQVLQALKTHGENTITDLVRELESIADHLIDSKSGTEPSFALQRDTTMPVQTDLTLRHPETGDKAEFTIEGFTIEIKKLASKNQIKIFRDDQPVEGIKIKLTKNSAETITRETDRNGTILY